MAQAVKEVESLRATVGNYEKDKAALTQSKARLLQSEKHLKHLEWENEVCSSSLVLPWFIRGYKGGQCRLSQMANGCASSWQW